MQLTEQIKAESLALRKKLQTCDDVSAFRFTISVSGRVHDGELKLKYKLSDSKYGGGVVVEGFDHKKVLTEFLRRVGWNQANQPLMIGGPRPEQAAVLADDEIPF